MLPYDPVEQFWQQLSYLREYLLTEGFPGWSFSVGLGAIFEYSNLADVFYLIPIIAGKYVMPYLFGWLQLLKIVLAASFMFLYLRIIGIKDKACIFGALSYAFCSIMIIRGNWYHYASEMVYMALLIYLLEKFFRHKKRKLLVWILVVIFSSRGAYFLCLYTILLSAYALVRYIIVEAGKISKIGPYVWDCVKVYLTALSIAAVFWIPSLYEMLTSERVNKVADSEMLFFSMENLCFIANGILRMFRYDIAGSISEHTPYINAPLMYIGLSATVFVAFSIFVAKGKSKRVIAVFGVMATLYMCVPIFRFLLNGFISYEYLKLSSAWIVVGLTVCATYGYQQIVIFKTIGKHKFLLGSVAIIAFLLLCFGIDVWGDYETRIPSLIYVIVALLIFILLIGINLGRKDGTIRKVILLLTCIELVIISYQEADQFTDSDHLIRKSEVAKELSERSDIFTEIKSSEQDQFYRISANEYYAYTNPLLGNYFDSSYYSSYANAYSKFCSMVAPTSYTELKVGNGIDNNICLESLIGSKYILKKQGEEAPYGCVWRKSYDGYDIYENPYAQNLGVVYDSLISQKMFENLTELEKSLALTQAVIVENLSGKYSNVDTGVIENVEYINDNLDEYKLNAEYFVTYSGIDSEKISGSVDKQLEFSATRANSEIACVISQEDRYMNYHITVEIESEKDTRLELLVSDGQGNYFTKTYEINKGINHIQYNAEKQKVQYVVMRFLDEGLYKVRDTKINCQEILPGYYNAYYEVYERNITERSEQSEKFCITGFSQNHIEANIEVDRDKILLFSIPYDEGWKIRVDGEYVEIHEADYGLMAIEVSAGYHEIELSYHRPLLFAGMVSTGFGIAVFGIMVIGDRRKRRKATDEESISCSSSLQ